MDYIIYMLTFLVIYVALASLLYAQFSLAGIVNFGIAGFWGLGMYSFTLMQVKLDLGFIPALLLTMIIVGIVALILGRVILNLESQSVLVGTLAFATIMEYLVTTEKWLTNGMLGLGTVYYPIKGENENLIYLFILILFMTLTLLYVRQINHSPYGRLLKSIGDNEKLAKGIGKPTFKIKVIFFGITCAIIGLFGATAAPLYAFIFPRMVESGTTFTIWIILLLGGRKKLSGSIIGGFVTIGLLGILVDLLIPLPASVGDLLSTIRYALYGVILILILMFRPSGIVGDEKRKAKKEAAQI